MVVVKSTVPVGTCEAVREAIADRLAARDVEISASRSRPIPSSSRKVRPSADFMKPDRIVVGVEDEQAEALLRELYAPFNRNHEKLLCMDVRSSELTKYAANAMLATKISLMNELSNVAARVGADIEHVRNGIGSDPRIGYSFIYPGAGYGGSCFPKDVRALERTASAHGYEAELLQAVEAVNRRQKHKPFELLEKHFGGRLEGLNIALWGLSFKPNTDDMREAPSLNLIDSVLAAGARIRAHDPQATEEAHRILRRRNPGSRRFADPYAAAAGADALVLMTEWKQYWAPGLRSAPPRNETAGHRRRTQHLVARGRAPAWHSRTMRLGGPDVTQARTDNRDHGAGRCLPGRIPAAEGLRSSRHQASRFADQHAAHRSPVC